MTQTIAYLEAVVGADITSFRRGMAEVRNSLLDVGGLSSSLRSVGTSLTMGITVPLLGLAAASVKTFSDFEAGMRNVNAIAQLGNEQFEELYQRTLDLGGTLREGPAGAAEALYTVFSAGWTDVAGAMEIATISAHTAEAGLADLQTTTEALVSAMLAYGASADEAEWYSDVLTRTVALGVGEMNDFAGSLGYVMSSASTLGVSFNEVGTALAYMTQRGMPASRAATSLNNAFNKLIAPSDALKEVFDELGVSTGQELIDNMGGIQYALQAIIEAADGNSELLTDLFPDERGRRLIFQAAADIDGFNKVFAEFNAGLEGATEAARAQQMESFAFKVDLLASSVKKFLAVIGRNVAGSMEPLVAGLTEMFLGLSEVDPALLSVAVSAAAAVAAVGPLLWVVGALLTPVGLLTGAVVALGTAFANDLGGIRTGALSGLTQAAELIRRIVYTLGLTHSDDATKLYVIANQIEGFLNIDTAGNPAIASAISSLANAIAEFLVVVPAQVGDTFRAIGNGISEAFASLASAETGNIQTRLIELITSIIEVATSVVSFGLTTLEQVFGQVLPDIAEAISNIIGVLNSALADGNTDQLVNFALGLGVFIDYLVGVFTGQSAVRLVQSALIEWLPRLRTVVTRFLGTAIRVASWLTFLDFLGNLAKMSDDPAWKDTSWLERLGGALVQTASDVASWMGIDISPNEIIGNITYMIDQIDRALLAANNLIRYSIERFATEFQARWAIANDDIVRGVRLGADKLALALIDALAPMKDVLALGGIDISPTIALRPIFAIDADRIQFTQEVRRLLDAQIRTMGTIVLDETINISFGDLNWSGTTQDLLNALASGVQEATPAIAETIEQVFWQAFRDADLTTLEAVVPVLANPEIADLTQFQEAFQREVERALETGNIEVAAGLLEYAGELNIPATTQTDLKQKLEDAILGANSDLGLQELTPDVKLNPSVDIGPFVDNVTKPVQDEMDRTFGKGGSINRTITRAKPIIESSFSGLKTSTSDLTSSMFTSFSGLSIGIAGAAVILSGALWALSAMGSGAMSSLASTMVVTSAMMIASLYAVANAANVAISTISRLNSMSIMSYTAPAPQPVPPVFVHGRASGGPVNQNEPYIVGEKGMELFVPQHNGYIMPNESMRGYSGSGGTVINNITVVTNDADKLISDVKRRGVDLKRSGTSGNRPRI